ncbi:CHAT domain-containing tetratricopeptide repeat protein [Moorena sp. SIO4G3]|uniref:CHAT domain-containing tetratricopeptide repeat protein n=1 Tax=Moorena sp. SIO4G3 TaxID=2607821 RepID=UPI0025ECC9BC|nr:CHAT domain-containing tetratricopeptide repeat protein [Moorena sp. SIO4G3]
MKPHPITLKQVLFLGLFTLCLTPGQFPVLARFLSLPGLDQEQNTVSLEQHGSLAPGDAFVEVDSKQAEADKLFKQGLRHIRRSEFRKALQSWQQALVIYKQIGHRLGEAHSLGNLGRAYANLGEYKQAINYYLPSIAIARKIPDREGEARSLTNLGFAYGNLGDYKKAIYYHQKSLAIAREIEHREGEARSLSNLGNAYESLGDYKKAIYYQLEAIAIAREIEDREGEAGSLGNLANAYRHLGDYEKAIDYQLQSLAIKREIQNRRGEAYSLDNLGIAYGNLGDYKKAINYHRQSLGIFREIGHRKGEAHALENLGIGYGNLEKYNKAIDYHQQSIAIAREIGHRKGEAISLNNLGATFLEINQLEQAQTHLFDAIEIWEDIRQDLGNQDDWKVSIFEAQARTYRLLQQVLVALGKPKQGLEISEQGRNRALIDLLAARLSEPPQTKAPTLEDIQRIAQQQQATLVEYSIVDDQIYIWVIAPTGEITFRSNTLPQDTTLAELVKVSRMQIGVRGRGNQGVADYGYDSAPLTPQFWGEQDSQSPPKLGDLGGLTKTRRGEQNSQSPPKLGDLGGLTKTRRGEQNSQSPPKLGDLGGLTKTRRGEQDSQSPPKLGDLGGLTKTRRTLINTSIQQLPNQNAASPLNTNNSNLLQHPLHQLYQLLITPIVDVLPITASDRIIFIPHQELFLVSFAALLDDQGKYLIENHTILTAPSIQSLWFTRKHWHRVQHSRGKPLIVGNPTMPTIKIGLEQKPLTPLKGAETEALTIAQLLNTKAMIGLEATEPTIVRKMAKASVIHFATHGLLDDVNSIDYPGAIALAPEEPDHDGFLTSREILITDQHRKPPLLKAKLVVLSACDTGRGEIKGEGVIGLSRSLIAAGVPSLVVSLWKIPDHDTVKLMREFYTNIYTHKMDKAKAMREAMLSMLNDPDGNPDPSAWAAFTVIGEAR